MVWDSPLISNIAASFGVDPGKILLHGNQIVEDREILSLLNLHGEESLLRFSSPQIRRRIEEIPWGPPSYREAVVPARNGDPD